MAIQGENKTYRDILVIVIVSVVIISLFVYLITSNKPSTTKNASSDNNIPSGNDSQMPDYTNANDANSNGTSIGDIISSIPDQMNSSNEVQIPTTYYSADIDNTGILQPVEIPPSTTNTSNKIVISYRIDDISFNKKQISLLRNLSILAHKYGITWDLAVIALSFKNSKDPATFSYFLQNQEIFEAAAHGYNHTSPYRSNSAGEFFEYNPLTAVPPQIQEQHISLMKAIFEDARLKTATQLFFVPGHAGDNNTMEIAEKYGYRLITYGAIPGSSLEYEYQNIIATKTYVAVPLNQTLSDADIEYTINRTDALLNKGYTDIEIIFHPINFYNGSGNADRLIDAIQAHLADKDVQYGFVSKRFS